MFVGIEGEFVAGAFRPLDNHTKNLFVVRSERIQSRRVREGRSDSPYRLCAIDRLWRLENNLRYLLHLHRDGQRAFGKRAAAAQKRASKRAARKPTKIVQISA